MHSRNTTPFKVAAAMLATGVACAHAGTPSAATVSHNFKNAILESGYLGKTLLKGYSTIEQASVSCNYSECTLGLTMMSNVGEATCKSEWEIVGLVDGNYVDGGPLLEALPNAGETQTHVWQGIYTVGAGSHTVTFELYLPCSANANQWSVRYLVTTP